MLFLQFPSGAKWLLSCPKWCPSVVHIFPEWCQVVSTYVTIWPRDFLNLGAVARVPLYYVVIENQCDLNFQKAVGWVGQ